MGSIKATAVSSTIIEMYALAPWILNACSPLRTAPAIRQIPMTRFMMIIITANIESLPMVGKSPGPSRTEAIRITSIDTIDSVRISVP
ncbi:hypothetical protein D3C73_1528780 [compost metagenome]